MVSLFGDIAFLQPTKPASTILFSRAAVSCNTTSRFKSGSPQHLQCHLVKSLNESPLLTIINLGRQKRYLVALLYDCESPTGRQTAVKLCQKLGIMGSSLLREGECHREGGLRQGALLEQL